MAGPCDRLWGGVKGRKMEGDQHITLQRCWVPPAPPALPIHPISFLPASAWLRCTALCLCPHPLIAGYARLGTIFGAGRRQDADPWACQLWEGSPAWSSGQKRAGTA